MSVILPSMPHRYKRLLQAMTLAVAIIYTTLVLYQSAYGYPDLQQLPTQKHFILETQPSPAPTSLTRSFTSLPVAAAAVQQQLSTQFKTQHKSTNLQQQQLTSAQEQKQHAHKQQRKYMKNLQTAVAAHSKQLPSSSSAAVAAQTANARAVVAPAPPPLLPSSATVTATHSQTTYIIRKDIKSFNFSDIEVNEEDATAAARLDDLARRSRNGELLHDLWQRAVTATPQPPITELDDIFISVKTTKNYHHIRLALIIKTWFQLARDQTWFFTDTDDPYYQEKTKGHLINTNCSQGHFQEALCCKMSAELDVFLASGKKWFCHFDDDNYVNVPRLVKLLDEYSPSVDWYLGKPSIFSPLEIHLESYAPMTHKNKTTAEKISFWFATGGAGFCLSRALTMKMLPIAGGGKFISIGRKIRFPDDVTMGFIIEHLLKVPLRIVENFHSHLEPMEHIRPETFPDQVSFSYAHMRNQWNVVKVDGFDLATDPRRFYSLHCKLFPYFSFCPPR
ncbi:fringe glycosyltransferase isoform X1 [Anastrepha ludens]|uniref:fringe glycosyltransferase isoform X1 n=1 Tax=Anastrepha ludens TaxID=28586 RepID=UPI0023B08B65|nr:fringe glycosyltransferase isoform X1 [Anastrepha ludens]